MTLRVSPEPAATLAEVAREAGVSIATASRVLNNSPRVSPDAHRRVCAAASRLRYVRQRAAAPATGRGVRSVAVVVHAEHRRLFGDAFFSRLITAAGAALAEHDVALLVVSVTEASRPTVGRYLHGGHVDGLIVVSDHGRQPLAGSLPTLGIPVAVVGRPLQPSTAPYVDADNRGGARRAVEYLVEHGRRAVAHIAGPPDMVAGADRLAGYRDALRDNPDLPVAYGDWTQAAGVHAMARLLDQRPRLDAVFAASDAMAIGALRALARAGRRVPDDVAVVGFDDHPLAQRVTPALTTVRQPIEEFGVVAARYLLAASGAPGPLPAATILPTTLVVRDST
ncbi:MAG TPA: LacI family DNA-binding transcriptional regulator [Micromonosporaceae bacterium]|nr:LacI family DNA-binding transcriptional regulator [Micromonosporaceae bacterium]